MLDLSPAKLLIVFIVAVVLVGPNKLPSVARQMGAAWRQLRNFHQKMESDIRQNMPDLPSTSEIARLARSPVAFLNQMAEMPSTEPDHLVPDRGAEDPNGNGKTNGTGHARPGPARADAWPADPTPADPHSPGIAPAETGWAAEAERTPEAPPPAVIPNDPSMN